MRKVFFNGNTIEMYSSIEELPVGIFQAYNRFVLMDSAIGSDVAAIANHISLIQGFIKTNQGEKAILELTNYHQLLQFIVSTTSPELASFTALVYKINGELNKDISEEGIKTTIKLLSKKGLTIGKVRGFLEWFKKKVNAEFNGLFPGLSNSTETKQTHDFLLARTMLTLKSIAGEEVVADKRNLEKKVYEYIKPRVFGGEEGLEVTNILNFEDMCLSISESFHIAEPKKMTVVAFYRALNRLKEMEATKKTG